MDSRNSNKIGEVYGDLIVSSLQGKNKYGSRLWVCTCSCEGVKVVRTTDLNSGRITDCGHVAAKQLVQRNYKHGHATRKGSSPTYESWRGMIDRCTNESNKFYHNYGGSGITVCDSWLTFENFLNDLGERPPNLTIDRINTLGNYEKGNCKWSTRSEQALNRKWQWNHNK